MRKEVGIGEGSGIGEHQADFHSCLASAGFANLARPRKGWEMDFWRDRARFVMLLCRRRGGGGIPPRTVDNDDRSRLQSVRALSADKTSRNLVTLLFREIRQP